jgi:hypothetical protein
MEMIGKSGKYYRAGYVARRAGDYPDGETAPAEESNWGQAIDGLKERSINLLHGDGFKTDATVHPPLPAPPPPTTPLAITPGSPQYKLLGAQAAARKNPAFQPVGLPGQPDRKTFCNIATTSIARATGAPVDGLVNAQGQPNLANADAETLPRSSSWYPVTPQQAQDLATKRGLTVLGVAPEAKHGHIVTVSPELVPGTQDVGRYGPIINNIGAGVGIASANKIFKRSQPAYYAPRDPK